MISRLTLLSAGLLLALGALPAAGQRALPSSGLRELWIVRHDSLTPAEQALAETLQGLANRKQPVIWMRAGGMYAIVEEQLRQEGVHLREAPTLWDLVRELRPLIKGAVVYKLGTPSLNVATTLCGALDGVAVDQTLLERAKAEGLPVLADARGMNEREALERYRPLLARGIAVEQDVSKPGHLRDFAVAERAFTYATNDDAFRTEVARAFGPQAVIYGWGPDEFRFVSSLSRANATAGPADWALNLSALGKLPAGRLRRPVRRKLKIEDSGRYVAFVMSDGDNIQWLCGGFVDDKSFYGSPLRGRFPMTWELSPLLADAGPRVLQRIYATARPNDGFVAGAGVPGYTYPHMQPDPTALARQAAPMLRKSDLTVVSVLNANEGNLQETRPILELPEVQGVIYKDYAPYNRRQGEIYWHSGKPCVSYRYLLCEGLMSPEDVARKVAQMPATPLTDESSYALVQVHAWSYGKSGGPMDAVRRTIELLPSNTHVVTADQLIALLRSNFAARHAGE